MKRSPFLLNAQLVRGSKCARRTLNSANFCYWFSCCFSMSSGNTHVNAKGGSLTFDQLFELGFAGSRDQRLLQQDVVDKPVYLRAVEKITKCKGSYSGFRLRRSMDLVSISPLLRRYSRMIPGGWKRRRNRLSFISSI